MRGEMMGALRTRTRTRARVMTVGRWMRGMMLVEMMEEKMQVAMMALRTRTREMGAMQVKMGAMVEMGTLETG